MKQTRVLVSLFVAVTDLSAASVAVAERAAMVSIVENGRSNWQIVNASARSAGAKWAAAELGKYIGQMSGAKLAIGNKPGTGPAVIVGLRAGLSRDETALLPPPATGHDGYAIAVIAGDQNRPARIIIAGDNGIGTLFGAYDLLERLGCRWFYPTQDPADPEVVPQKASLTLAAGKWAVASPFKYRIANGSAWFFDMNLSNAARQLDWAAKNRYNLIGWQCATDKPVLDQYNRLKSAGLMNELARREMLLHGPGHSFNLFLSADKYMAEHPEWFGLRDGKRVPQTFFGAQFCWSNADARRRLIDNIEEFVKACPELRILFSISFDGGKACECPNCKRIGASTLLLTINSELIERMATAAPNVLVEALGGYEPVTEPPAGGGIHPKQRVLWAHWGRHYGIPYNDDRYGRKDNLEKWRNAARAGMTICQYYTDNFAEPWILPPFTVAMTGDRQYMIDKGIDGVYMLMWSPGYWWNHSLNGYLAGRCFYDASLDPFKEIDDYAVNYFGPRAGPLIARYYEQWAREVDLAYRVKGESREQDRAMLAAQRKDWIDPAAEAVKGEPLLSYRVSKVARLHTLAEHLTEAHRQREEIRRLREAGKLDEAADLLQKARAFTDDVLKMFHALADANQGLIDKGEIPSFITAGVKGWIDEEARAIDDARWEAKMASVEPAFANPVYEGADPWVTKKDGHYYLCKSEGDQGISVWKSDKLTDPGTKRIVWMAPDKGWNSHEVWAPELHHLNGRWYIYYAASDGKNANHRSGVLEAKTDDPQGEYIDKGMLYTGDDITGKTNNRWSIDMTPLQLDGRLYGIWSGWPSDADIQYLYIAPMANPWTISGNRVKICENDTHVWERVGQSPTGRGLHEGPEVLKHGDKVFIVYSCSGSWEPTYKLGLLHMDAKADPLDPKSWKKVDKPAFQGTDRVLGVGHASFTRSPDGSEDWIVYHSKISPEHGWKRAVWMQPFTWNTDGFPDFGKPAPQARTLKAPAGEAANTPGGNFTDSFDKDNWDAWRYFGYNRYIWAADGCLNLGGHPKWGLVNDYRSGEKALVRGLEWSDFTTQVRVQVKEGNRDAGLLFRVRRPAIGYDAQKGYFAGIIPQTGKVVLGKTDGTRWQELAIADHKLASGQWYTLRVEAIGRRIRVSVDDARGIEVADDTYSKGMIGVRVVDTHALFDDFKVSPK